MVVAVWVGRVVGVAAAVTEGVMVGGGAAAMTILLNWLATMRSFVWRFSKTIYQRYTPGLMVDSTLLFIR